MFYGLTIDVRLHGQRYLGQMPSSVLSQHYDMVDTDRLRKIADVAQRLVRTDGG